MRYLSRLLFLTVVVALSFGSVRSQEPLEQSNPIKPTSDQSESVATVTVPQQTQSSATGPNDKYVFPTGKKRFNRYVRSTVGPFPLLRNAAAAGIDQWNDNPDEWGQGAEGYGKRFASNIGKNAIRQTVSYRLSEAFRLDTGFERSKRKGFWPRLGDALIQNVTSRTRTGKRVLSAPIFIGVYSGSIIPAETWYPSRYSYKDGLRSGTYSLASGFAINVLREFVINW